MKVKTTAEHLEKYKQANESYQKIKTEASASKNRRNENLHNFKIFTEEWKHQLAIFFFSNLKDEDLEGYDEHDNCFI